MGAFAAGNATPYETGFNDAGVGLDDRAWDGWIILHNLALENEGPWWKRMFRRWHMSDEPLRHDAARLLRERGINMLRPIGTRYVE